jgi:hypothetical protein
MCLALCAGRAGRDPDIPGQVEPPVLGGETVESTGYTRVPRDGPAHQRERRYAPFDSGQVNASVAGLDGCPRPHNRSHNAGQGNNGCHVLPPILCVMHPGQRISLMFFDLGR